MADCTQPATIGLSLVSKEVCVHTVPP